ncbi:MAG: hypothetical protein ACTSU7_00025 [Candidatus Heimdallarchaeaceae archaeon]
MTKPLTKLEKYAKERIAKISDDDFFNTGVRRKAIWEITHFYDKCVEVLDEN